MSTMIFYFIATYRIRVFHMYVVAKTDILNSRVRARISDFESKQYSLVRLAQIYNSLITRFIAIAYRPPVDLSETTVQNPPGVLSI